MRQKDKKRFIVLIFISILAVGYLYLRHVISPTRHYNPIKESSDLKLTESNYGIRVDSIAEELGLPSPYFKALIVLECSGRINFEPRFESHVFEKLKRVRDKKQQDYYGITYDIIHDAPDEALKNLATSWGPFQLMGYQCINMGVKVQDIRGKDNVYWGMVWINKRYGNLLKKKNFEDAFHIHNTGRPHPTFGPALTHDPDYVSKGLSYIQYFENRSNLE